MQEKRKPAPMAIGGGLLEDCDPGKINSENSPPAAIAQAARWYADHHLDAPRPLVPLLRRQFGLSTREAVRALQLAGEVR